MTGYMVDLCTDKHNHLDQKQAKWSCIANDFVVSGEWSKSHLHMGTFSLRFIIIGKQTIFQAQREMF